VSGTAAAVDGPGATSALAPDSVVNPLGSTVSATAGVAKTVRGTRQARPIRRRCPRPPGTMMTVFRPHPHRLTCPHRRRPRRTLRRPPPPPPDTAAPPAPAPAPVVAVIAPSPAQTVIAPSLALTTPGPAAVPEVAAVHNTAPHETVPHEHIPHRVTRIPQRPTSTLRTSTFRTPWPRRHPAVCGDQALRQPPNATERRAGAVAYPPLSQSAGSPPNRSKRGALVIVLACVLYLVGVAISRSRWARNGLPDAASGRQLQAATARTDFETVGQLMTRRQRRRLLCAPPSSPRFWPPKAREEITCAITPRPEDGTHTWSQN